MKSILLILLTFFSVASFADLKDYDPQMAKNLVEKENALLIDVRTTGEWSQGHVKGAHHMPISGFSGQLDKIKKITKGNLNHPIVVYCAVGGRASKAKKILTQAGFKKVTNMGGYKDWPR